MFWRSLTVLLALTLSIPVWLAPRRADAASGPPLRAVAQRGGLRLELTVPHSSYPRDALVAVGASMRNTTRHTLWIQGGGPQAPGKYLPQVDVLDGAGSSLPLSLTTFFPYPGPGPASVSLAPGATIGGTEEIVLRGARLRLGVTLLKNGRYPMGPGVAFHTRVLHVHLLPADPPVVQIKAGTSNPVATISRPAYAHGLPQAVWYADCGGTNFDQRIYWSSVSTRFVPACSPLHAWHALIGWRGHSVAAIDWPGS